MQIIVNNEKIEINDNISISDFLKIKKINPEIIVIELNNKIIDKTEYDRFFLKDNSNLNIISFVGGG